MTKFQIKRIYDEPDSKDGYRVLVDRLWPRGLSKEAAKLDEWAKAIAPSNELRKWFGHDPAKFDDFEKRYIDELATNSGAPGLITAWHKYPVVTLLYAAHDELHNQAVVLQRYLG